MKRGTKLIIMSLILAVAVIAGITVSKLTDKEETTDNAELTTVLSVNTESVISLSREYGGSTLAFSALEGEWVYSDDTSFPLDGTYITNALSSLSSLVAEKVISEPAELSEYGLDSPEYIVTVNYDDGTADTLNIGNLSSASTERYVSVGDGRVYMVDSSVTDCFSYSLLEMAKKDALPSFYSFDECTVSTLDGAVSVVYSSDEGSYSLVVDGEKTALGDENVNAFTSVISGISPGDCVSYKASSALEDFGLSTPACTVTVLNGDEHDEIYLGKTDSGCYMRINDSNMIYNLDESVYTSVTSLDADTILASSTDSE